MRGGGNPHLLVIALCMVGVFGADALTCVKAGRFAELNLIA
jgi:hypothetical protein